MENQKKKSRKPGHFSLMVWLVCLGVIPMVTMGLVMCASAVSMLRTTLQEQGVDKELEDLAVSVIRTDTRNKFYIVAGIMMLVIIAAIIAIRSPINKLSKNVAKLAAGNYTEPVRFGSILCEVRRLGFAAQDLQMALNDIIGTVTADSKVLTEDTRDIGDQTDSVTQSAHQIMLAVDQLHDATNSMAHDVQGVGVSIHSISDAMDGVAASAARMSESSHVLIEANTNVSNGITTVYTAGKESVDAVERISKQIKDTSELCRKIDTTVDEIITVSKQTKLLSINAAIEASHVGEAGRGFAVVADSIKDLSAQSETSANDVSELSEIINRAMTQCVELSDRVLELISAVCHGVYRHQLPDAGHADQSYGRRYQRDSRRCHCRQPQQGCHRRRG